jgi:adenosylcobinamide-GDP ribazoletransferase
MKKTLLALQFLTIIPVSVENIENKELSGSAAYFPLIGLLLGCVVAAVLTLGRWVNFPEIPLSALIVVLLAILTGGIHLDGLADLFDALGSGKSREEMLAIMRDPRTGAMGVIAIVCALLLKTALLSALAWPPRIGPIILMCVVSRWAMVFLMYRFPYARQEGKAKIYLEGMNSGIFFSATAFTLGIAFLAGRLPGLAALVAAALGVYCAGKYLTKKLGGITGDALGAVSELTEIFCLIVLCL